MHHNNFRFILEIILRVDLFCINMVLRYSSHEFPKHCDT